MAIQKQPSRTFRKVRFGACLPNTTVSLKKRLSQSSKDIK